MYSPEEREAAIAKVIAGLRIGTPLTVICSEEGMPSDDTIRDWADADTSLSRDIARAREAGFDALAIEALTIADTPCEGVVEVRKPVMVDGKPIEGIEAVEVRKEDMLGHRKLQVETRLKLLAKWDPKRYGDRQLVGSDPDNPLPQGVQVVFQKPASE